jgi:hypothetical protein
MLLLVMVQVGGRMLLFLLVDNGLLLVGLPALSLVVVVVVGHLPVLVRGQPLLLLIVGGWLQLVVFLMLLVMVLLLLLLLLVVGVLHVGILQLMVLVRGPLLLHLLADI